MAASVRGLGLGDVERQLEVRGELAGDADDAHRIGPVGRDRQVEDDVVEPEDRADVASELAGGIEAHDPRVVVAEPELACRQQHAVGHDAADRAAFEREAAGQRRARGRVRRDHPGDHVRRSAHDARLPGRRSRRRRATACRRSGCFTTSSTLPATTPLISSPGCSTLSTSRPSWFNAATRSGTGASTGVKSRIQDSGARISTAPGSGRRCRRTS